MDDIIKLLNDENAMSSLMNGNSKKALHLMKSFKVKTFRDLVMLYTSKAIIDSMLTVTPVGEGVDSSDMRAYQDVQKIAASLAAKALSVDFYRDKLKVETDLKRKAMGDGRESKLLISDDEFESMTEEDMDKFLE